MIVSYHMCIYHSFLPPLKIRGGGCCSGNFHKEGGHEKNAQK